MIYALIAVLGFALGAIVMIVVTRLPDDAQIAALKEWLKYAVTMAEKELGSGTGQLKLRMVYDLFVAKFTWLARFITFETFEGYVDEALEWLRGQLESNKAVAEIVSGESEGVQ